MVAWEHKDLVGLLMVMVGWVEVQPKRCHKCCHHPHYGCVANLRVDNEYPSDGIHVR